MDQVRIFDSDGIWIEQVRTLADRAWAITKETSARFAISVFDPKCNPYVLNYGNLVLIEQSDGLPDWVGMIDDISFERGACIVSAYTPERYFTYRRGPRTLTLVGRAGEIFASMIKYINGIEKTPIVIGNIATNTTTMQETINPVKITKNLDRLTTRSGEGYRWRPEVERGKLIIYADWFPSLVAETGLILQDGYNISGDHPLNLSAPINDYLVYGAGSDWSTRPIAQAVDDFSRGQYGLRQGSENINTESQDTLDEAVTVVLNSYRLPNASFPLSALNVDDTFQKLMPGAMATFTKLVGHGFSNGSLGYLSYDRVISSMAYEPANGIVLLAI